MLRFIVVASALAVALCHATTITCDTSQNYGGAQGAIYNTACPADRPYCTGSGLCSECAVGKDSLCDCPPNYKCAAARFNVVRDADFCSPMPLTVIDGVCADANECGVDLEDQRTGLDATAFFTSCVNSECRYCNGRSFSSTIWCKQEEVPGGGDARVHGSKTGPRSCIQASNAWNSDTEVLSPPLPTDPYEYERSQYPTPSGGPVVSLPASLAPTPTPSLSTGASPSVTSAPTSGASMLSATFYLVVVAAIAAIFFV